MLTRNSDISFIFEGLVDWAVVHEPRLNKGYEGQPDTMQYRVDVRLTKEDAAALQMLRMELGVKQDIKLVKPPKSGKPFVEGAAPLGTLTFQFRRTAIKDTKTGEFLDGPIVLDKDNNRMKKETLIGNGSLAQVTVVIVPYHFAGQTAHKFELNGIKVLNLVAVERTETNTPPVPPNIDFFKTTPDKELPF